MPDTVTPDLQARVLDRIDDEEIVRLAPDLIRIPSFTTEETPCAEWLADYLGAQGLAVTLQEIEPGRKQTIARLAGTGGRRAIQLKRHTHSHPPSAGGGGGPLV